MAASFPTSDVLEAVEGAMDDRTYALLITICAIVFVVSNFMLAKSGAPTQVEYFCEFLHLFCGPR